MGTLAVLSRWWALLGDSVQLSHRAGKCQLSRSAVKKTIRPWDRPLVPSLLSLLPLASLFWKQRRACDSADLSHTRGTISWAARCCCTAPDHISAAFPALVINLEPQVAGHFTVTSHHNWPLFLLLLSLLLSLCRFSSLTTYIPRPPKFDKTWLGITELRANQSQA